MNEITYRSATQDDLPAIRALLDACRLPVEGLELLGDNCVVAKAQSEVVGTVALEPCGRPGLLRSLAVAPDYRRRSLGRTLFGKMVSHARLLGVERLYLLTTDAEGYFSGLGFTRLVRE